MPSKIQLDENLWFLYICLQKSDYKAIDFNAVGDATKLKPPAARMRYTRLRRAIEGGTLIGTHGMLFQKGSEEVVEVPKKRKRLLRGTYTEELDDSEPLVPLRGSLVVGMEKVGDGSVDQDGTGLLTEVKKAPSIKERAWGLKRMVDGDEETPGLASVPLRSEERIRDTGPDAYIPSPITECKGDVGSKNNLVAKCKRRLTERRKEEIGTRNHELAPPDTQQPVQTFKSWHGKGLCLKRETDEAVLTDPITIKTEAIPEGERHQKSTDV